MSEIERVEEIRNFLKFNKKTFTKILGNSTPQSYTNFLNGTSNLSMRMINGLIKHDPRLNINWILTGQGQMLLNNDTSKETEILNGEVKDVQIKYINNKNTDSNTKEVEYLKKEIELLKQSLKDKEELITMLKKNQK